MSERHSDERQDKLSGYLDLIHSEAVQLVEQSEPREALALVHMMHGLSIAQEHIVSRLRDVADMTGTSQAKVAFEIRRLANIVTVGGSVIILLLLFQRLH